MKKHLSIIVYAFISICIGGCSVKRLPSPEKIVFTGSPQLPLLYSEISFLDLKKPTDSTLTISVNEQEGYYEMKKGPIPHDFPQASTLITLADVSMPNVQSFTIANGPANLPVISYNIPIDIAGSNSIISGASLQEILLDGGDLALELISNINKTLNISLTFTGVVEISNNLPLILNYQLDQNNAQSKGQNLNGYKLVLNGTTTTGIKIAVTVNSPAAVPTPGTLSLNSFSLSNLKWSRINGKLGNVSFPLGSSDVDVSSIGIDVFSSSDNTTGTGMVFFAKPTLTIDFKNTFGFSSQLFFKPLVSLDKDSILLKDVTNFPENLPINITKASDPDISTIFFPHTSTGEVRPEVLVPLLTKGPKYIKYGLVLSVSGTNTNDSDFILSTSQIKTKSNLKLPLFGYLKDFKINSSIKAPDFSTFNSSTSGDNFSLNVNYAEVNFDFENKFPLVITTKIEFLNSDNIAIPNLGTNITIGGANFDAQGNVTSSLFTHNSLSFDKQQFTDLKNQCKFLRITGNFNSANAPQNIKIFPTNKLGIQISIAASANGEYDLNK